MAILISTEDKEKLKTRRTRRYPVGTKPGAKAERKLAQGIQTLWNSILRPAAQRIRDLVKAGAPGEEIARVMDEVFRTAQNQYHVRSQELIWRWTMDVDSQTKSAMMGSLTKTLGVDIRGFYDTPEIKTAMELGARDAANKIVTIPSRYLDQVSQAVLRNFRGEGQPEGRSLLEQIDHIGKLGDKRHARLIARDQTNKMVGALTQTRQTSIGIEEYTWRTVGDNRVVGKPGGKYPEGNDKHMDHYHRNGKVFRWDSPPPDGHPGSGIQCLTGSTDIDFSDGCHKLWRRFYSGDLVSLRTSDGGNLEATPNHPVMTHRGLVPINVVQEGDYLIERVGDSCSIGENYRNKFIAKFDDLFCSCEVVSGSESRRCSEFDFHGDGVEGDVHTIDIDSFLLNNIETIFSQGIGQFVLPRSITTPSTGLIGFSVRSIDKRTPSPLLFGHGTNRLMGGFELMGDLFLSHPGISDIHTFGSSSDRYPYSFDYSMDYTSTDTISGREVFDAFTRHISGHDVLFRKIIDSIVRNKPTLGDLYTSFSEIFTQYVGVTPHLDGCVFKCGTVLYKLSRVAEKTIRKFSSHVYNLQSSSGLYIANNFVIGNCRCFAVPVIDMEKILSRARTV